MKIAVLGTGMVGEALATKLVQLGNSVTMGSRTADNETATQWAETVGENATHATFADAAANADVVINCTQGIHSLEALNAAGAENLSGKLLIDVANIIRPQDSGPVAIGSEDGVSLGEQIQTAFPDAKVVKTLNTLTADLMVNPKQLDGHHMLFICGNDSEAKTQTRLMLSGFGWSDTQILDLGDIVAARGTEAYLAFWLQIMQKLGTPNFNVSIVK